MRRLQEALEEKRSHRLESSGSLLQDARTTLESIREAVSHKDILSTSIFNEHRVILTPWMGTKKSPGS